MHPLVAVAHACRCDLLDPVDQRRLVPATCPIVIYRARNHHHRARLGLTRSILRLQVVHQFASACGLQIFRRTTSCSMTLSRLKSATSFLSLVFSSSSCRSRRSSDGPSPENRFFQLKNVAWAMPILRQISSTGVPSSCCFRAKAICSSVNRDFFTTCSFLAKVHHAGNSTFQQFEKLGWDQPVCRRVAPAFARPRLLWME